MPNLSLEGVSIHYQLSGSSSGPVLLFSSSLGTTLDMWAPQLDAFERHFQVLRYDMRGHGRSSTPLGPYSIEQLGGDVLALLDALDIPAAHLCGLSIGGVIGQWLGIHAPSRIEKLILCNTAAKIGTPDTWNIRMEAVQKDGMAPIVAGVLARWFAPAFLASDPPVLAPMRQMLASTDPAGYIATCAALRDMDLRAQVASIPCPTLLLAGEHDLVTTVEDSRFLAGQIPNATLSILPAAHISSAEVPDRFNTPVLEFLTPQLSTQDGAQ